MYSRILECDDTRVETVLVTIRIHDIERIVANPSGLAVFFLSVHFQQIILDFERGVTMEREDITIEGFHFGEVFFLNGLKVRILKKDENEIIGTIYRSSDDGITVKDVSGKSVSYTEIKREEINKIRRLKPDESFQNTLYFDDEEKIKWENKF